VRGGDLPRKPRIRDQRRSRFVLKQRGDNVQNNTAKARLTEIVVLNGRFTLTSTTTAAAAAAAAAAAPVYAPVTIAVSSTPGSATVIVAPRVTSLEILHRLAITPAEHQIAPPGCQCPQSLCHHDNQHPSRDAHWP